MRRDKTEIGTLVYCVDIYYYPFSIKPTICIWLMNGNAEIHEFTATVEYFFSYLYMPMRSDRAKLVDTLTESDYLLLF